MPFLQNNGILIGKVSAASNHSDTSFSFTLGIMGKNSYTGARDKLNATSAYVKVKSIGKGRMDAWLLKANGGSVNSKEEKGISPGEFRYIINWAFENNGNRPVSVKLVGETSSLEVVAVQASGVWSPDSI